MHRPKFQSAPIDPPAPPSRNFMNCVYRILNRWVKASSLEQRTERFALDCGAVAPTLSETTQAEYTSELEAIEAEKATLITEPYIARDSTKQPILGYFPGAR